MTSSAPNVLLIISDQHRADCLGCYGNAEVKTPSIDELAADGVVHEQCFTTFPVCTPARYSLLTGLYAHQHLGWTNRSSIPPALDTYPRLLKKEGYETACVGKMHFTPTYADVGFDEMILAEQDGPGRLDDDYHRYLRDLGLIDAIDVQDQVGSERAKAPPSYHESFGTGLSNLDERYHSTTWIGDRACEVLERWEGDGHLLVASFIKPHHPFDPPREWADLYDPGAVTLLPGWTDACLPGDLAFHKGFFDYTRLTPGTARLVLARYYATISQVDHHVGRMINVLRRKGLYDDTLIIYTADHGEYMGHHHLLLKANYMYDPLVRVPLVVKHPGGGGAGTRRPDLASIVDITATILDAAGAGIPQALWETARPLAEPGRDAVFAEDDRGNYMVRTPAAKLLLCQAPAASRFFDLVADPFELVNVIDEPGRAADVARLKTMLLEWLAFSARSRVYAAPDGPVLQAGNARRAGDGHRPGMEAWIKREMASWRDRGGEGV